ncbi:hypothetical protein H6796_00620 [Candidatus Nomurabacteria bacterium]|nr:hypothetical protein [Candidatus Nomurabacteria bacterium]
MNTVTADYENNLSPVDVLSQRYAHLRQKVGSFIAAETTIIESTEFEQAYQDHLDALLTLARNLSKGPANPEMEEWLHQGIEELYETMSLTFTGPGKRETNQTTMMHAAELWDKTRNETSKKLAVLAIEHFPGTSISENYMEAIDIAIKDDISLIESLDGRKAVVAI